MQLLATQKGVIASIAEIAEILPDRSDHQRIFQYNAAQALFSVRQYGPARAGVEDLIEEYYELIGIDPADVIGRNADKIKPLLKAGDKLIDNVKHLADCLDLHAKIVTAEGSLSPFGRIHAMKFYEIAHAPDSFFRVGQDLVDDFISRNDFIGARDVMETILLPAMVRFKMVHRIIPIRSQYAVVLAYCGDFGAAEAEMERLAPYEAGLRYEGQWELRNQRGLIAKLRREGPPPQWVPHTPQPKVGMRVKVGRNDPCPCNSGKKYKKCHGQN